MNDRHTERTPLVASGRHQEDEASLTEEGETNFAFQEEGGAVLGQLPETGERGGSELSLTPQEFLYRLHHAPLYPGLDWLDLIRRIRCSPEEKFGFYQDLLESVRGQPLPMAVKLRLSSYLKDRMESASILRPRQSPRDRIKRKPKVKFSVDFLYWGQHINKISAYLGSSVASYFSFLRFLTILNLCVGVLMLAFTCMPQILPGDVTIPEHVTGYFGELSTSIMFYGAYGNSSWGYYDRPLGYFLTWTSVNLFSFVVIVIGMYVRYRRSKLVDTGEEYVFSHRLFSSWDFSLADKENAKDSATAIKTDFRETIREAKASIRKGGWKRVGIYIARVLANILVLGLQGGSGFLIYLVADMTSVPEQVPDFLQDLFTKYELPATVAALKVVVPLLFFYIIRAERWHPRIEIKLTIARTTLFYLASLIVFVASLYSVSTRCVETSANSTLAQRNASEFCCWENEVGEEVFKLVIIDLGLTIALGLVFDVCRALMARLCCARIGYSQYDVASGVLDLIYGQALIWLGLYFSPFLVWVGFLKNVIIFYFHYVVARQCKAPPNKVFRAQRSGSFYYFVLLVHLFCSLFPMVYAVVQLQPSKDCGPFMGTVHAYDVITVRVGDLPSWLRDVIQYASTPAIILPALILFLLIILYFKAKAGSYQMVITNLRRRLQFEHRVERKEVFAKAKAIHGLTPSPSTRSLTKPFFPSAAMATQGVRKGANSDGYGSITSSKNHDNARNRRSPDGDAISVSETGASGN